MTPPRTTPPARLVRAKTTMLEMARTSVFTAYQHVDGSPRGLVEADAIERLQEYGENAPTRAGVDRPVGRVVAALRSPFVTLLGCLGAALAAVGNLGGAATVVVMLALAVALRWWQRTRLARATRALHELVTQTATVRRRPDAEAEPVEREVPVCDVVPGDLVLLRPCDVVPADLRIVSATGLLVDESALTGESLAAQKSAIGLDGGTPATDGVCFSGSVVVSGTGSGVVLATGNRTYFSSLAAAADDARPESSFDRGVRSVGWTLVRFMLMMAPIVFLVSGTVRGNWAEAAMFAVAVAVGLTPEMLPVVVTTNLARGAIALAKERVVVRRLNALQDLGAVDVLCVDKTGTLTEDRIVYADGIDAAGRPDDSVTELACVAVHFQDDVEDRVDEAIVDRLNQDDGSLLLDATYVKVDEVESDYRRRRTTVVVSRQAGEHILICKGDPDRVLSRCTRVRADGVTVDFDADRRVRANEVVNAHRRQGMQLLAIAARSVPASLAKYGEADERELVLVGFVGFIDPVRASAATAVATLDRQGVAVKILTGDSVAVAVSVAARVGVDAERVVRGRKIDELGEEGLQSVVARSQVFAELDPGHKARIVAALRGRGHVVGFLGDGVNDVAALRIADAGIAPDTATDAAKQAADVILLDSDLAVVARGVTEGRRTLANTMKYVRITASSNFGNALSVVAASAFLPFLPMLPIHLMVQNLLYDSAQLALPWDRVDDGYLRAPRRWQSGGLVGFMMVFGALSSAFDLATFAVLWWVWHLGDAPATFQTGWFMEGLLTQLLAVLVLRAPRLPWRGARVSPVVVLVAGAVAVIGLALPWSPVAHSLGMTPLPASYAVWLVAATTTYGLATQGLKAWYLRRRLPWL